MGYDAEATRRRYDAQPEIEWQRLERDGAGELLYRVHLDVFRARIRPTDRVLEVGTGSGFVTALLARLAAHVLSVERLEALSRRAAERLAAQGIVNVTLQVGDGRSGWPEGGPFDAIAVTGSLPTLDETLTRQLAPGGRLFVVVGSPPVMEALLLTRVGEADWARESLFETDLPPLRGLPPRERFVF